MSYDDHAMKEKRYISSFIEEDLADRMVFIGGARQVGKTTLALSFLSDGMAEKSPASPCFIRFT